MQSTITHINNLVNDCRLGNQRAQMEIYNRYYRAMYNTALRIVHHSAEAEDIMQESFLSAFEKIDQFKAEASFGAWLKRIVVNNSINAHSKRSKYEEVSYKDYLKNEIDDNEGITTTDTQNQKVKMVLNAMQELKENYRICLTLHLIEGYDYEEIGDILNISYANCRTTISRAKESLRKKMMKDEK
ncbi:MULTISPECIES: RNA polymerase sigma factor [Zunongwangia]|nr:RNA polymerase sigma factor [Zunongwangia profunda]MCC4229196.1 RNA polymerase sigma factor [Zunongwangia profunda]HAJ82819.1 RNA polymerase sigma factor [Zunongwangia profunda]HCV81844.1 RNA polymerase sigma factor [Zunongwangia profunda]